MSFCSFRDSLFRTEKHLRGILSCSFVLSGRMPTDFQHNIHPYAREIKPGTEKTYSIT
jgi:hypothetical protein